MAEKEKNVRIRISNVRCAVNSVIDLCLLVQNSLGLSADEVCSVSILKRSTDARQERVDFVYTLEAEITIAGQQLAELLRQQEVSLAEEPQRLNLSPAARLKHRPVIIGAGPAGLFAARALLARGVKPIIIERGERIAQRIATVGAFWQQGMLNPESNVLYGEGGAGTFSDGKLTTRIKSPLRQEVLKALADYGAPSEIVYLSKPHVGTDLLRRVIPAMVDDLQRQGADFYFNTALQDIQIGQGRVTAILAGTELIKTGQLFLATGHSARDVYVLLHAKGVRLESKGFAIGLRIEHPQELINARQFGPWAAEPRLGAADYVMSFQDQPSARGIYTFCMCPGGSVIACASAHGELCTNGMSTKMRDSGWANAAVVVTVQKEEFNSADGLAGLDFQRQLEQRAFQLGGGSYHAPAQRAADFVSGRFPEGSRPPIASTYRPGITEADLTRLLPDFICEPMQRALLDFNRKMPGFVSEGVLLGVETRTSSPVRILREPKTFHAVGLYGLIPTGEGSGYAGGIMSSAVDGIKAAMLFDAA